MSDIVLTSPQVEILRALALGLRLIGSERELRFCDASSDTDCGHPDPKDVSALLNSALLQRHGDILTLTSAGEEYLRERIASVCEAAISWIIANEPGDESNDNEAVDTCG